MRSTRKKPDNQTGSMIYPTMWAQNILDMNKLQFLQFLIHQPTDKDNAEVMGIPKSNFYRWISEFRKAGFEVVEIETVYHVRLRSNYKECCRCGKEKHVSLFHKDQKWPDGLKSTVNTAIRSTWSITMRKTERK